jgi:hypothetical protein
MHESTSCSGRLCDHAPMWARPLNRSTDTKPRARWITKTCTQSMWRLTAKCLHWHFQPLPGPRKKVTCLNYYRPVALTSGDIKCFDWLVMAHINIMPETLDPLQIHR